MVKFYKLARYLEDGKQRTGFLREEGIFLPNNYGLELVVYRAEAVKGGDKTWYVVECSSGAGLSEGRTRTEAVRSFEEKVEKMGLRAVEKAIEKSISLYGRTPDHEGREIL